MRKILILLFALFLSANLFAQDDNLIAPLNDDFKDIDTVKVGQKFHNIHMIGVKYGYTLATVSSSPSLHEGYIQAPYNFSLLYTCYHAMWDYMPYFGFQTGIKYGEEGYSSDLDGYGERYKKVEIPLIAQFKIDFSRFRILANLGTYYGYRLSTDKEGGFDRYDIRNDYGIIGGAGFAVIFEPLEFQIEANYQYSLCSVYHTNKMSDMYWLITYPRNILISFGVFIHL